MPWVKTESKNRIKPSTIKLSNKGACLYESLEVVCTKKTLFCGLEVKTQ
jgi:hypothetical protein